MFFLLSVFFSSAAPNNPGIGGIIGPAIAGLGICGIEGSGGGEGKPRGSESCGPTCGAVAGIVDPGAVDIAMAGQRERPGSATSAAGAGAFVRSIWTKVVLCGKTIVSFLAARSTILIGSSLFVVFSMRRRFPVRVKSNWVASVPA